MKKTPYKTIETPSKTAYVEASQAFRRPSRLGFWGSRGSLPGASDDWRSRERWRDLIPN